VVICGRESSLEIRNQLFVHETHEIMEFDGYFLRLAEVHEKAVGFEDRNEILGDKTDNSE